MELSKEEVNKIYEEQGSFKNSAKFLKIKYQEFRKLFRKVNDLCMRCSRPSDQNLKACKACSQSAADKTTLKLNKTKQCKYCTVILTRTVDMSNDVWSRIKRCSTCNSSKGPKTEEEYLIYIQNRKNKNG